MISLHTLIHACAAPREYQAARMAADVLEQTALVDLDKLWSGMRPVIAAELERIAEQVRTDAAGPTAEPEVLLEYAAELERAAKELRRQHHREAWARWRKLRKRGHQEIHSGIIHGMLTQWRAFQ